MRMAIMAAAGVTLAFASTAGSARAEGGSGSAVQLGLRTGYALPLGDAAGGGNSSLGNIVTGMIPIWLDAGYRLNPNIYIGADFAYGITFINNDKTGCGMPGASCSSNDLMFGIDAHYHFMPDAQFDPWAGVGVGYEILSLSEGPASANFNGFQFLNLQGGADYKVTPQLGVGPFLMFSLGQYSSCSESSGGMSAGSCTIPQQAMHEWLTIGVRGTYDIPM